MPSFFYRMGLREGFSSIVGSQTYLRARYNINCHAVVAKVHELLGQRNTRQLVTLIASGRSV